MIGSRSRTSGNQHRSCEQSEPGAHTTSLDVPVVEAELDLHDEADQGKDNKRRSGCFDPNRLESRLQEVFTPFPFLESHIL
jgi:hypothetical protein